MTDMQVFPAAVLRIRVKSGQFAGQWLKNLRVSRGGVPIRPLDMGHLLKHPTQYKCHPIFTEDEFEAYTAFAFEVAEGYVEVLNSVGIDAELVVGIYADEGVTQT